MEISEENKKQLMEIKDKKMQAVKEQNFEKAASFRDQEVDFMESHFGIDIRNRSYSIRENEIIFNDERN